MDWTELLNSDYRALVQQYLSWSLIVAAFVWGGGPERAVAATWLVCFKGTKFVRDYVFDGGRQLLDVDFYWAFSDLTAGALFVAIGLFANRNYTMWIAGLQLLAMSAHIARGVAEAVSPIGYAFMVIGPSWIQLFFLGIGLLRHVLRKRKHGEYRDWRIKKPKISIGGDSPPLRSETAWPQGQQPSWRDDVK